MTEIDQRIPDLSDKELERLHANAVRLQESGTPKQREQAASLLPLVAAALEQRRAVKAETQAETRRVATEKRAVTRKAAKAEAAE